MYPRARTREASAAAAPETPLPFRIVTEIEPRGRSGSDLRLRAWCFADGGCFAASERARCMTGLAISATPTITSPSSSSVAIPAATTAIVRQGW